MGLSDGSPPFDAAGIDAACTEAADIRATGVEGVAPIPGGGVRVRRAASLVHVVPGLRLRLWVGDEVVGRVGGFSPAETGATVISPCRFRRGVGALWQAVLEGGDDPDAVQVLGGMAIDMGVPPGGAVADPGVHQVPSCPGMVFAYASTLPADVASAIARDAVASVDEAGLLARSTDLVCRHDPLLDTTVYAVHAPHAASFAEAQSLITDIAVRCTVEELLLDL